LTQLFAQKSAFHKISGRKLLCFYAHLFRGKIMRQNGNTAKLCVRKTVIGSSIQAQGSGDFMSQKWRSYGFSDTLPRVAKILGS
jgi:hypothetical protein